MAPLVSKKNTSIPPPHPSLTIHVTLALLFVEQFALKFFANALGGRVTLIVDGENVQPAFEGLTV
jgi:hypothetical protein